MQAQVKSKELNVMQIPKITKLILSAGATGADLDKAQKLLEILTEKKAEIIKSGPRQRIPTFGVKPNMPLGTRVTLRGKNAINMLKRLLGAIENTLSSKQIENNHFSFGIKEYIEIPDAEYIREIGIRGFNVTVVFERAGVRVKRKKIKKGKYPKRQQVLKEEIIQFMKDKFKTRFTK